MDDFESIKYKDCGGNNNIKAVIIPDCNPSLVVCNLQRGHNYKLYVTFTSRKEYGKLKAEAEGKVTVFGMEKTAPLPLEKPDACLDSGLQCPLKKGLEYTYKTHLSIPEHIPSIEATVAFKLLDDNKESAFCFEAKYKIV